MLELLFTAGTKRATGTFAKSETPIVPGQKFVLTFEDDFDDLLGHIFIVQGFKVS